jgi:hypothetical protein
VASPIRSWVALGVLAFVGNAAVRPAIAAAANDEEPTVTPYGMSSRPAPPAATPSTASGAPARAPAPTARAAAPTAPPPAGNRAPAPAPAPAPASPYPAAAYPGYPPGYAPPGYPPPGYAAPGYAPYPQYAYPPQQLTTVHRPRRGLVTGGAITFGVSWGIAASFSFIAGTCTGCNDDSVDYLWVPVAGPLIVASNESSSTGPGIFILWSAAQAAGIIMFIVGVAGHDVMEYRIARGGPTFQLAPLVARQASGLGLTARW